MSIYDLIPAAPRVEYLSNDEHRRLKTKLTRAERSGAPLKVLAAVEDALETWSGKAWPDEWSRWARALEDAYRARLRVEAWGEGPDDPMGEPERLRWQRAAQTILR